jgi:expansin (peptidoglycan-binding protein)
MIRAQRSKITKVNSVSGKTRFQRRAQRMKFRVRSGLVAGSLLALLAGACGAGSDAGVGVADSALASADGAVSATISFNDWGSGYTGNVTVTNNGSSATTSWAVMINSRGSSITQTWNATSQISGTQVKFTPVSWNAAIAPHQSVSFGFNAAPGGVSNEAQLVSVTQSGASGGSAGASGAGGSPGAAGASGAGGRPGAAGASGTAGASGAGGRPGAAGASGAAGSPGAAGAGGSSGGGATACSLPPALGVGQQSLTWYFFGQGTARNGSQFQTACGYLGTESGTDDSVSNVASPNDYFVAIPGATSNNFTNSNYCGACVQINNTNNGRSVTATVIDECPIDSNSACATAGHLDVSKTAFDALGFSTGNPSSGVSWKVVPCNVAGNVKVRVKSGNANQVYIENERLPLRSVTQNGAAATRLFYGAWQLPNNAAGTTLVLTDTSGRTVSIAVSGSTADQDTGKQFPTCQ